LQGRCGILPLFPRLESFAPAPAVTRAMWNDDEDPWVGSEAMASMEENGRRSSYMARHPTRSPSRHPTRRQRKSRQKLPHQRVHHARPGGPRP
jgi:hypothetical protein